MMRIYIVIPRTVDSEKPPFKLCMSCGRMAAHAAHAAAMVQDKRPDINVSDLDLIVLSVGSSRDLLILRDALKCEGVQSEEYKDVDKAFEGELLTAICTWPIEAKSSKALNALRPWKCACNET